MTKMYDTANLTSSLCVNDDRSLSPDAMRPCFTDASISIEDASTGEAILGSAFSLCQTAIPPTFVGETHCIYFFADASRCSTMVNVRLKYHFGPGKILF